jgi:hypothetical protein
MKTRCLVVLTVDWSLYSGLIHSDVWMQLSKLMAELSIECYFEYTKIEVTDLHLCMKCNAVTKSNWIFLTSIWQSTALWCGGWWNIYDWWDVLYSGVSNHCFVPTDCSLGSNLYKTWNYITFAIHSFCCPMRSIYHWLCVDHCCSMRRQMSVINYHCMCSF